MLYAIASIDKNWGIGYSNELLERIPEDLKNFKEMTAGSIVVMGRKTYESIPNRPLKNRLNIVITKENKEPEVENVIYMTIDKFKSWLELHRYISKIFLIGGGSLFKEFLSKCDMVYLTKIDKEYPNVDTYFKNLDNDPNWDKWPLEATKHFGSIPFQFWVYENKLSPIFSNNY